MQNRIITRSSAAVAVAASGAAFAGATAASVAAVAAATAANGAAVAVAASGTVVAVAAATAAAGPAVVVVTQLYDAQNVVFFPSDAAGYNTLTGGLLQKSISSQGWVSRVRRENGLSGLVLDMCQMDVFMHPLASGLATLRT
ncbi:unnamed protein product [Gongylonema pulchrum]|uniref:Secreted protein n=1 Tax=Gongylonema pulchrum TaxID=637853 RepID=A0A183DT71_9BILA|nr:unnamed protein product [Gongylonema pulchrum]